MTHKEAKAEAKHLIDKYISAGCLFANAKTCALIDIQNSIDLLDKIIKEDVSRFPNNLYKIVFKEHENLLKIKSEIELL